MAHSTNTRSSSVDQRHFGLPSRSQFSAGARNEPSARKMTSRQLFHSQRVSFIQPNSLLIPPLRDAAGAPRFDLPSPSTMHSLRGTIESEATWNGMATCSAAPRAGALPRAARNFHRTGARAHRSTVVPSGQVEVTEHPFADAAACTSGSTDHRAKRCRAADPMSDC